MESIKPLKPRAAKPIELPLLLQSVFFAVYGLFAFHLSWFELSIVSLRYQFSLILVALCLWSLWSWGKVSGSIFDPYGVFLIAAMLFNAGQVFLEVLGLNRDGMLANQFSEATLVSTLRLVTLGLAGMHLGALLRAQIASQPSFRDPEWAVTRERTAEASAMRVVGWTLFLISVFPSLLLLRDALQTAASSGYHALYERSAATGVDAGPRVLASFLAPALILITLGSKRKRTVKLFAITTILSFAVVQLFLGYRANAVMPIVGFAWAYHRSVRRIPKPLMLGTSAFFLFVVFPLVRLVRNIAGEDRLSLTFLWKSFVSIESPVVAILSEMGGSMNTVAYTIDLVPSMRPFDNGQSYMYAILGAIPNLFWSVHPSVARGTESQWLVWQVDPYAAARSGGLGYSFIAEAYLNFGSFGGALFLCSLGFSLASLVYWTKSSTELARVAMVGSFLCFLPYFARGESLTVFRPLIWYALLPYVAVLLVSGVIKSGMAAPLRTHTSNPTLSKWRADLRPTLVDSGYRCRHQAIYEVHTPRKKDADTPQPSTRGIGP